MIKHEYIVEERTNMRDGAGTVTLKNWIANEEMPPHLRMSATLVLPKGASIGEHSHEGEAELFFVLSGTGEYVEDGGAAQPIAAGDVMVCYSGHSHSIKNTGTDDLQFQAVIITE